MGTEAQVEPQPGGPGTCVSRRTTTASCIALSHGCEVIGDGVLAMFPVTGAPAEACEAALRAISAARAGMAHLDAAPQARGLPPLSFGAALHLGEILWGNIGAADRLDFTAIGPAVNLEPAGGAVPAARPLGADIGAVAAETTRSLMPLGEHVLRGIGGLHHLHPPGCRTRRVYRAMNRRSAYRPAC